MTKTQVKAALPTILRREVTVIITAVFIVTINCHYYGPRPRNTQVCSLKKHLDYL